MFGVGVTTGIAVGGSVAMLIGAELPKESPVVQKMFNSKNRAAILSSVCSLAVGAFCGPVAGVISEMINYPVCLYKVKQIERHLRKENGVPENAMQKTKYLVSDRMKSDFIIQQCFK